MRQEVIQAITEVRSNKGLPALTEIVPETSLRIDLEMDSLDLAEFTARLESKTGVDIFEQSIVSTVGDVLDKLA